MFNRLLEKVKSFGSLKNPGGDSKRNMASGRVHSGARERVRRRDPHNSSGEVRPSSSHNSSAAMLDGELDGPDNIDYKSIYKLEDMDLKVTLGEF